MVALPTPHARRAAELAERLAWLLVEAAEFDSQLGTPNCGTILDRAIRRSHEIAFERTGIRPDPIPHDIPKEAPNP